MRLLKFFHRLLNPAALLLLLCLPLRAETGDLVFPGMGASLGWGRRVTARITFDRKKASGGGFIFAAPSTRLGDEDAIRMSEAVVTASAGLLSHAALTAREHRVPALILGSARWEKGALALEIPVFGPERTMEGFQLRLVEKISVRRVKEEDVVTVDAARGALRLYPPSEARQELELAWALRAFDGLKDPQSLAQWFEGQAADSPAPSALAGRLLGELSERVVDGSAKAGDLLQVMKSVEKSISPAQRKALNARMPAVFERELSSVLSRLAETEDSLKEAGSAKAAERLESAVRADWSRIKALAEALGAQARLSGAEAAYLRISRLAGSRIAGLLKKGNGSWIEAVLASGAEVPRSADLPNEFYRRFLAENLLEGPMEETARDASLDLRAKSGRIKALIAAAKLEPQSALGREILGRLPEGEFYAVVGGQASLRFLRRPELLAAVKEAWAGFWGPAELGARKRQGLGIQPEASVTIESIVPAGVSGVLFTRDPGSGNRERRIVDAVFGEMEGLFLGAPSDQYVMDRSGREALPALVADKREKFGFDPARKSLVRVTVPAGLSLRRTLSPDQLRRVCRAGRALENHFGYGLEVAFAFAGERLFILSARPLGGAGPQRENPFALSPAVSSPAPKLR